MSAEIERKTDELIRKYGEIINDIHIRETIGSFTWTGLLSEFLRAVEIADREYYESLSEPECDTQDVEANCVNHSFYISRLRNMAKDFVSSTQSVDYLAAADLLELHDRTGISLEKFGSVGDFVNLKLAGLGLPPFTPNGA